MSRDERRQRDHHTTMADIDSDTGRRLARSQFAKTLIFTFCFFLIILLFAAVYNLVLDNRQDINTQVGVSDNDRKNLSHIQKMADRSREFHYERLQQEIDLVAWAKLKGYRPSKDFQSRYQKGYYDILLKPPTVATTPDNAVDPDLERNISF